MRLGSRNVHCGASSARIRNPNMHCFWVIFDGRAGISKRTSGPYFSFQHSVLLGANPCRRDLLWNQQHFKQLRLEDPFLAPDVSILAADDIHFVS